MMAVVDVGGRQYQVSPGDTIRVQKVASEVGEEIVLDRVLMLKGDRGKVTVGKPFISRAQVKAKVTEAGRAKKIIVFKYKRRKGYHRKYGHRQPFSCLLIEDIVSPRRARKMAAEAAPAPESTPVPAPESTPTPAE